MDDEDDYFFEQFSYLPQTSIHQLLFHFRNVYVGKKTSLKRQKKVKKFEKHVIFVNVMELVRDVLIHVINVKKHCAKFMSQKTFAQLVDHL